MVKKRIQIQETEKKSLLYHNTFDYFKKYTRKVYTKPFHKENENEESTNNVATTTDTKKSTPMLRQSSVPPRDKLLTEIDRIQTHKSKSVYSVDQIGYGKPYQRSAYTQNTDSVNQMQYSFSLMPPNFSRTRFTVEQQIYHWLISLRLLICFTTKKCYTKYSCKYEREKNGNGNVSNNFETKLTNRKKQLFHLELKELET